LSALSGTVDVPGVGRTQKAYVAVAGAAVAGLVGYAYWRRRQADAGAAPAGSDGGLYVDTRTGSALPSDQFVNPAPNNADSAWGTGIGGTDVWQAPHTDQEWAQQAVDRLSWYEPGYVSATVGKYLARQPLTTGEQTLVRELWGLIGHPPTNQPILTASSPAPTPKPTPSPSSGPAMKAPTGLRWSHIGRSYVQLDWAANPGVVGYVVYVNGKRKVSVVYSTYYVSGLKANTSYHFQVAGLYRAGKVGPKSSTLTVKTKK
jgi:hypothetical protein